MKNIFTIPVMVSAAVLLAACGGGGDSSQSTTLLNKPTIKIKGTVPGTLIEAFCEDGSYYSVKSNKNQTAKHPFSLSLPKGLSCRLLMTTHEDEPNNKVVTAIKFIDINGASSIAFSTNKDIDIGYIALATSRAQMQSDENQDGVEDIPKEVLLSATTSKDVDILINRVDKLDADSDGIINVYEDDDGDKINNRDDNDDDGDGILDIEDNDRNNDGQDDHDSDADGIKNAEDTDDDNDGQPDAVDTDDDNDGISDQDDSDHISNQRDSNSDVSQSTESSTDNTSDRVADDNGDVDRGYVSTDEKQEEEKKRNKDKHKDKDKDKDKDEEHDDDVVVTPPTTPPTNPPTTPTDPVVTTPTAGRLLAAQCAQCHGTDGVSTTGIDSLAGESRNEIIKEMREMKNKNKNKLMHLQAKGYSDAQVLLIADYFSGISGGKKSKNKDGDDD